MCNSFKKKSCVYNLYTQVILLKLYGHIGPDSSNYQSPIIITGNQNL